MQTTWVVAADSYRARILEFKGHGEPLQELEDWVNPVAREDASEVARSPKGRFFRSADAPSRGGTTEYSSHPIEQATERFADNIADYLDKGRNEHRFQRLFIVADPKFLGILRGNMNKHVSQMVEKDAAYEISNWDNHHIADFVDKKFGLH